MLATSVKPRSINISTVVIPPAGFLKKVCLLTEQNLVNRILKILNQTWIRKVKFSFLSGVFKQEKEQCHFSTLKPLRERSSLTKNKNKTPQSKNKIIKMPKHFKCLSLGVFPY